VTLFIDLLLISALAFCSGRGFPQIRSAFVVAPMAAAFRLSPRRTAAMSAVIVAVYILVALTHPTRQQPHVTAVLAHSMFVVWTGVAAVAMSALRVRRQRQILALSEARGRLVAQTIDTEERVRKRVSGVLHDHVIQGLLTARQELTEARAGDRRAVSRVEHALDEALGHLRNTIEDLDPYLLDHLDLPAAISAIAGREARRGGYRVEISTQPDAVGVHDALIAALSRELLGNAARHANASVVKLELTRADSDVVLQVADDGRGFTREQALTALRHGHIGLAASRERVEAIGGSFVIDSHPGAGTCIRCHLPAQREPALSPRGTSVSDVHDAPSLTGRAPAPGSSGGVHVTS
jgi:two-component system NarL family sensor kinase